MTTAYLNAVRELFDRIAEQLGPNVRDVKVYVAGGAAVHWYTRTRATSDVDAEFAGRFPVEETIVHYIDEAGDPRDVYLDRNYNPMFSLLHEDYQVDAIPVGPDLGGAGKLRILVLSPLDLAVSKLSRWQQVDQEDVHALAKKGLIDAGSLEKRANEALGCAIGVNPSVRFNIAEAVNDVRAYSK